MESFSETRVVSLAQELIRLDSCNPPGSEKPVADVIARELSVAGFDTSIIPLGTNRANVVGRLRGQGDRPALLLCGHLDTVPVGEAEWTYPPLSAALHNGRLYGRGAVDMKAGMAASVVAACAAARSGKFRGDLIVLGTVGEEAGLIGAKSFRDAGNLKGVGAIAIPEPTNLELVVGHKGAVWLRLVTKGKAGHGSMPEQGVNAIDHMMLLLDALTQGVHTFEEHPLLGRPTINIGTIGGGTHTNVVAERCEATVDIRTLMGHHQEQVLAQVRDRIAALAREFSGFSAELELIASQAAVMTPVESQLVRIAIEVGRRILRRELIPCTAPYYTDASVLSEGTIPTIILGPGRQEMAHQMNEQVEVSQIASAVRFYVALIERVLG